MAISHDVILRFQGFKSLEERKQIGGLLASFITSILESAEDPREAAHFTEYFLRERLSKVERRRVADYVVTYENQFAKLKVSQEAAESELMSLFEMRSKLWTEVDNDRSS